MILPRLLAASVVASLLLPRAAMAQEDGTDAAPEWKVCDAPAPVSPSDAGRLSVVWISPLGRKAAPWDRLTVVPSRVLRAWMDQHDADLPRLLAGLGLKRPQKRIRRPWKAVVFEVDVDQLCRPTDGAAPGSVLEGVAVCPHGSRSVAGHHDDCGQLVDRVTGRAELPALHVRWPDASARGFCVLPLERWIRGD